MQRRENEQELFQVITVVLLDDNKYMRVGIEGSLRGEGDIKVVLSTDDVSQFLQFIRDSKPDVAIIDLHLYGDPEAGFRVIEKIEQENVGVECLIHTNFHSLPNFIRSRALRVKAFAYVIDTPGQPSLSELVRRVVKGETYFPPHFIDQLMSNANGISKPHEQVIDKLSDAEKKVLVLVGEQLSNQEIALRLSLSIHTVKAHMKSVFKKLNVTNREDAYRLACHRKEFS